MVSKAHFPIEAHSSFILPRHLPTDFLWFTPKAITDMLNQCSADQGDTRP